MNAAQLHLALNHFPLVLVLVGVALLALALWRKSTELKSAACGLLVLAAIVTIPVYFSGEPTEHLVEHKPGVTEANIHAHEEAAELSALMVGLLGISVLAAWIFDVRRKVIPAVWWVLLFFGLVNFAAFVRTAHLGGMIRHDEISRQSIFTSALNTRSP